MGFFMNLYIFVSRNWFRRNDEPLKRGAAAATAATTSTAAECRGRVVNRVVGSPTNGCNEMLIHLFVNGNWSEATMSGNSGEKFTQSFTSFFECFFSDFFVFAWKHACPGIIMRGIGVSFFRIVWCVELRVVKGSMACLSFFCTRQ